MDKLLRFTDKTQISSNSWQLKPQGFSKYHKTEIFVLFFYYEVSQCYLYSCEGKLGMLISFNCLISYTDVVGHHVAASKRETNMAHVYCVMCFSENYFHDNFVLKSTTDSGIVNVVCFNVPINSFASKFCSRK